MRLHVLAAALLAAGLTAAGCSGRFESFQFTPSGAASVAIREKPRVPREQEAVLDAGRSALSPLYRLASAVVVRGDATAFSLTYRSTLKDCRLAVFSQEGTVLREAALPPSGGPPMRLLLPLPEAGRVWGWQLSTKSSSGTLTLLGAGTAPRIRGIAVQDGAVATDGSLAVRTLNARAFSARFPEATRAGMAAGTWVVSIRPTGSPNGLLRVVFRSESGGRGAERSVSAETGRGSLDFSLGSVGFIPSSMEAEAAAGPPSPSAPVVLSALLSSVPDGAPIPADPGQVLDWDRSLWRRPDYELFSWSMYPRVLIFDTADYAVQDGMFKRLAFFVEKAGYAGSIPAEADLQGRHGYNAHDYRPEDLARFFTEARTRGIALTSGETELLRVLESFGLLREKGSGLEAGEGGVISISRSSPAPLRRLLVTHECYHGVFFSVQAFRDAAGRSWDALSPVEQEVWRLFLSTGAYNAGDPYLVVNEFQAYLFQQERSRVRDFQAITLERLRKRKPEAGAVIDAFLREHPDSFQKSFDALDAALRAEGGPPGGAAIGIQ
jgi:hypothetical protein